MDEVSDLRKQVDELKYLLQEKQRQNIDLQDDLVHTKRALEDKYYEAGKLSDESSKKTDHLQDLRVTVSELARELEGLKVQRAEIWNDINRLKEQNEYRVREGQEKSE